VLALKTIVKAASFVHDDMRHMSDDRVTETRGTTKEEVHFPCDGSIHPPATAAITSTTTTC